MRAGPNLVGVRAPRAHAVRRALSAHALRPDGWPACATRSRRSRRSWRGQPVALAAGRPAQRRRARPVQARWAVGMRSSGGALKPSGVRRFRFPRPAVPQLPGLYTQPGWMFDPAATYGFGDRAILRDGHVMATFPRPAPGRAARAAAPRGHRPGAAVDGRSASPSTASRSARAATRRLDFVMPVASRSPDGTPAALELRAAPFVAHRDAMLRALEGDVRAGDAAHPPRAPRAGRVLREPRAHPAAALPAARRRLGAAGQQAALPRVLAARRVDHDPGARPRRAAPRGRREPRLLRSLAARRRPVHLARGPARRPRPGDVGDRRARAAQPRPRVRPRRAAVARARRRLAAPRAARPTRSASCRRRTRATTSSSPATSPATTSGRSRGSRRRSASRGCSARTSARKPGAPSSARCARPSASAWRAPPRATAARSRRRSTATAAADWGNLWAAWPSPVLDPSSPLVTRTLARARAHFREGLATYGEFHNLHHYLGFRVWQTELVRGEQAKVVQGLYDSLAHTTNTNGGFETGVRPYARRSVDDNLAPHGWFAAELVALLRNMLVREARRRDRAVLRGAGALARSRPPDRRARRGDDARHGRRHAAPGARRRGPDVERRRARRARRCGGACRPPRAACARRGSPRARRRCCCRAARASCASPGICRIPARRSTA